MKTQFHGRSLALLAAAVAMACADPTGPTRTLVDGDAGAAVVPHPINFAGGATYPLNSGLADGVVRLCKSSNATGSFEFTWSLNGAAAVAIPGGPLVVTDIATPACRNIYTSYVSNTAGVETVVITEAADQSSNWALIGRDVDQYYGSLAIYPAPRLSDADNTGARSVTVYINNDLAKKATFTNRFTPTTTSGCTYTKGWYQNKNGSPTVTMVDGRTKAQAQAIFAATPGKPGGVTWGSDNLLLNLYQQLLAAILNLGGDANVLNGPNAVDTAIATALQGTGGTGKNITTTLTQTEMSALVVVLSNFNEGGYPDWPHCY
jgi:hypothetical protein